ncbi:hypothetical protein [Pseudactinotalea sp. Z1748]|uniref:hypothetical protein n=1 Tax=Pseudactinotalea sp. Z1748 TaxID=3413027 RepID=UPI003C7D3B4C
MAKKDYRAGKVRASATAALSEALMPHAYARRTDGGFSLSAQVVGDGRSVEDDG